MISVLGALVEVPELIAGEQELRRSPSSAVRCKLSAPSISAALAKKGSCAKILPVAAAPIP